MKTSILPALATLSIIGSVQAQTIQSAGAHEPAQRATAIVWDKLVLDGFFRSEGVATGDVDRDGDLDVLAGELWYEAPQWQAHEIRPSFAYDPLGLSASFADAAVDVDGDGWLDELVVGVPGAPCYWYRNPQGAAVHWAEHLIAPSACNEHAQAADVDGDGRLDLLMSIEAQQQLVWLEPALDPTQPWIVRTISQPGQPGFEQFYHGLGFSDLDLDLRPDVLTPDGWYRAPLDPRATNAWTFQAVDWRAVGPTGEQTAAHMFAWDFDGDGDQDVVTSSPHSYGLWWWEQRGLGSGWFFEHLIAADFSELHALQLADINGDGLQDLVTGKRWWAHGPGGDPGSEEPVVLLWFECVRAHGTASFLRHAIDPGASSGIGTQFEVVDIDADGDLDVVTSNKKGVFVHLQRR